MSGSRLATGAGLIVLALAFRVAFLINEPTAVLTGDEASWVGLAKTGIAKPWKPFAPANRNVIFYPPLYPWFLRGARDLLGSWEAAKALQVSASLLLIPAVLLLGSRLYSWRVGVIASAAIAAWPDLLWFSTHFYSETLFITLLWWAIYFTVRCLDSPNRLKAAAVAGACMGTASLVRETALYFSLVIIALLVFRRRSAWRQASIFAAALVLVVSPWTYRNWKLYDAFVPVSTFGAFNLWRGNTALPVDDLYEAVRTLGPIEAQELALRRARVDIESRQPEWFFEKVVREVPRMVFGEPEAWQHAYVRGAYLKESVGLKAFLHASRVLAPAAFVLGGIGMVLSLRRGERSRARWLLFLFVLYYVLMHTVTFGTARFAVPLLPAFLIFGIAFARGFSRHRVGTEVLGAHIQDEEERTRNGGAGALW